MRLKISTVRLNNFYLQSSFFVLTIFCLNDPGVAKNLENFLPKKLIAVERLNSGWVSKKGKCCYSSPTITSSEIQGKMYLTISNGSFESFGGHVIDHKISGNSLKITLGSTNMLDKIFLDIQLPKKKTHIFKVLCSCMGNKQINYIDQNKVNFFNVLIEDDCPKDGGAC